MKKCNIDRSHYLFDNQALVSLIVPLIIEQLLTVLVGMADSIMVANVGEAAVSGVSLVDQIMVLLINIFAALVLLLQDSTLDRKIKNRHVSLRRSSCGLWDLFPLSLQHLYMRANIGFCMGCSDRLRQMLCIMQMFIF